MKMQSEQATVSTAIVGGGVAGLVAALELLRLADEQQRSGSIKITIFEKAQALGGRASTAHKDGFALNQGPHALYNGGFAHQYLEKHGLLPGGNSPSIAGGKAVYQGEIYALPADLPSMALTKYLSVGEKLELGAFFQKLPSIDIESLKEMSFVDYLKTNLKAQPVRDTVEAFARLSTYSNNMALMAAGPTLGQLRLAFAGVTYLDGGWQSIVTALKEKLNASGAVDFVLGQEVTSVRAEDEIVTIVTTQGEQIFDAAILCLPPLAIKRITANLPAAAAYDLSQIKPSNAACYDVCLTKLSEEKHTFALGIDEPLYYSVHSKGAKLAPEGHAMIHLACYLKDGEHGGESHKLRLQTLLDQLQPGWRANLVYERFLPNMTASYGAPATTTDGHMGLTNPRLLEELKVYACGDFVGSGHMLVDASVDSACEAAGLLLQDIAKSGQRRDDLVTKA